MGTLSLTGVLPISGINVGLVAALPALNAQVAGLQADLDDLAASLLAQAEVALNVPPPVPSIAAGLIAQAANLPGMFDPAQMVNASADYNLDAAAELGFIEAQLALVGEVGATLSAGLDTGGISLWTYAGRAAGFGTRLNSATRAGYPGASAEDQIQGLVIATEDFDSWGNFSATFNAGDTAELNPAEAVDQQDLSFEGTLGGEQLNTGVLDVSQPINLYLAELEGAKLTLQAQIEVSVGLNLPPIPALTAALNVDVSLLIDNMINVNVSLTAQIELIQLKIDVLLELIGTIEGALSAGGLALWIYSGPAGEFGADLETALADGVPGGSGPDVASYGVALATKLPAAWAAFGLIFAVA